jgi:hypothetical protein
VASIDTAGTTVTGGLYIFGMGAPDSGGSIQDISKFNLFIAPGEILTISGYATSAQYLGCVVGWTEDI